MDMYTFYLFSIMVVLTSCSAIPKPGENDYTERVVTKLSEHEHWEGDHHSNEYDHEAFLGEEEAKKFDRLTPKESIERLSIIVDKIDKDKDGFVTETELKDWLQHVKDRIVLIDTDHFWTDHEIADNDTLKWESYKQQKYGHGDDPNDENAPNYTYKDQINRDERRWKAADRNNDGVLSKEEFSGFVRPEEAKHMRDVVAQEILEGRDKNKDGFLSVEEYIGEKWSPQDGKEEPNWVKDDRIHFKTLRDKNGDGKMDTEEVKFWLFPPDFDHLEAEAKHLIYDSDLDTDGKLSKSEILEKHDLFVGSQATSYGAVVKRHDEF